LGDSSPPPPALVTLLGSFSWSWRLVGCCGVAYEPQEIIGYFEEPGFGIDSSDWMSDSGSGNCSAGWVGCENESHLSRDDVVEQNRLVLFNNNEHEPMLLSVAVWMELSVTCSIDDS
jgi:hypothetical protein